MSSKVQQKSVFGRQGAQGCGDVWLRNSLCCSDGTCHHTALPPARVCTGSPGPFWDSKGNWCVWGQSTRLGFPSTPPIHHPGPEERSRRSSLAWASNSSVRTVAESCLVTWEVRGRLFFALLREEVGVGKVGCRDQLAGSQGLSWV